MIKRFTYGPLSVTVEDIGVREYRTARVPAKYWYEKIGKPKERSYDPEPEPAFKETIVFGGIPGEKFPVGVPWPQVKS